MKRFTKIYIEIGNICNLSCSFCPGTTRPPKRMTAAEFACVLKKIKPYTDFIYLHLMGEPLLHPELDEILSEAENQGFKTCITTNGTLLSETLPIIRAHAKGIHKISISLQAMEANKALGLGKEYITNCIAFARDFGENRPIIVYRLWNEGGLDEENESILRRLHQAFPGEWKNHPAGNTMANRVFLEYGETFEWPDANAKESGQDRYYCFGLKDHIGILADGTITACCLDNNGSLSLGNIFTDELADAITSDRAKAILEGFKQGKASEDLCRKCGYASRFIK